MHRIAAQPRGINLRQILPHAEFPSGEITVSSCCADAHACRMGDLFVALPSDATEGHNDPGEAIARGAKALLADRPIAPCKLPVCYVDDAAEAYGQICQALAGNPARRLKTIGVTGTNGKTTTSYLIASVLAAGSFKAGVVGSLGYFDGDEWGDAACTTPPANLLATWLARMAANGCSHAVVEVSSLALAQRCVAGVDFDVACITNSLKNNRPPKAKLLEQLAPEGFAIVNVDDPGAEQLLAQVNGPVLSVGMNRPAEVTAIGVELWPSEQTFLLSAGNETIPIRTPLIGAHNITNCLLAAAVGLVYSIDLPTIVAGLEAIQRVPGRLERIECGQPFAVFVDRARTPETLSASLETLRGLTSGRLICVFGAGGDRDKSRLASLGRAVVEAADLAVVTGEAVGDEPPDATLSHVLAGLDRPAEARVIGDRRDAIVWALEQAQPGDCVLLAGKGHETFPIASDQRFEFNDREIARSWLYQSAAALGRAA